MKDGVGLRNYLVAIVLVLTFFSGCEVSYKSRAERLQDKKVIASASACHDEEDKAKELALAALSDATHLPSLSEFSDLRRTSGEKAFCYEAVLRYKEWSAYLQDLQTQRTKISSSITDQNNSVLYDEKAALIESLQAEQNAFNEALANVNSIAPSGLAPFDLNQTALENAINAVPSVGIALIECNRHSNYKCQVGFISKVKDESKEFRYYWEFGDGEVSTRRNPLHTYPEVGEYNATLQVQDSDDVNNSTAILVKVEASEKPVALFNTKRRTYTAQKRVDFKNMSYSQKSKVVSYQWSFGDGYKSSKRSPKHVYTKAGEYIVVLKVCNAEKFCTIASKKIVITPNKVLIDAKKGIKIEEYIAKNGQPSEEIVKKNALMSAYKYGTIWLLTKRGKIECAVKDTGLSINLMGQPKKCYWHERNAKQYMVELQEED